MPSFEMNPQSPELASTEKPSADFELVPKDASLDGLGASIESSGASSTSAWERADGSDLLRGMESPAVINSDGSVEFSKEPLVEVTFDLGRMKDGLTIRKNAYEYAVGKLSEMEANPLKGAFQEEADKSKEGYRTALEAAKLKLKEMMTQTSEGDMDKMLRDEYVGIVREIASLNQRPVAEDLSRRQAA